MVYPIHIKTEGAEAPSTSPHYIVAGNGTFIRKESWWVDATVPVKTIGGLEEEKPRADLKFPALSALVLAQSWRFFKSVYRKYQSEAVVMLHFSRDQQLWEITVPKQTVTAAHASYEMTDRLPGYFFIGTLHSHGSMRAFHSHTDIGDEAQMDGIHITLGNINLSAKFSMDAEVVVNGSRFALPFALLGGVVEAPSRLPKWIKQDPMYTIVCPEIGPWRTPARWMDQVTLQPIRQFTPQKQVLGVVRKPLSIQGMGGAV